MATINYDHHLLVADYCLCRVDTGSGWCVIFLHSSKKNSLSSSLCHEVSAAAVTWKWKNINKEPWWRPLSCAAPLSYDTVNQSSFANIICCCSHTTVIESVQTVVPEVEPDVVGDPLCLDDRDVLDWGLLLTWCLDPPYSEVELTDRVVSAGKYGTGTVLMPPDKEYLKNISLLTLTVVKTRVVTITSRVSENKIFLCYCKDVCLTVFKFFIK